MCQLHGELRDVDGGYDYIRPLQGLIQDMMEATSNEEDIEAGWMSATSLEESDDEDDEEGEDGDLTLTKRGPTKWYQKLAARILTVGVNYFQGILALQAMRKAAADRDKVMPKFPLF